MAITPPVGNPIIFTAECVLCKKSTPVKDCFVVIDDRNPGVELPCCQYCYTGLRLS